MLGIIEQNKDYIRFFPLPRYGFQSIRGKQSIFILFHYFFLCIYVSGIRLGYSYMLCKHTYLYMHLYFAYYMFVYHSCAWYPQGPKVGVISSGIGAKKCYEWVLEIKLESFRRTASESISDNYSVFILSYPQKKERKLYPTSHNPGCYCTQYHLGTTCSAGKQPQGLLNKRHCHN